MEDTSFDAYKQQPTAARLAEVLKARQDHVYNICFQILRHPEDAEDAAQEVLLELARGVAKIGSPRQLKVWLYRVAVHSALDRKEARARAHGLARKRAAAPPTEGRSMDSEERAALMRAIGGLDDRTRCILLEHYFDKLTLEEIGEREGVSNVAIWKRLDRAKGQLRRALMGAGFSVAAAGLAHSLESLTPVAAPAGLAGKAALAAAGGIVVGTKTVVSGGGVVAALLLLGATAGGGYLIGGRFSPQRAATHPKTAVASGEAPGAAALTHSRTTVNSIPGPHIPKSPPNAASESDPEPDWDAVAKDAFEFTLHIQRGRIPVSKMQATEVYARLNEKTGPWFAVKYREAIQRLKAAPVDQPGAMSGLFEELGALMDLAARSGGQEVADLFLERLSVSGKYEVETANLGLLFGGISGWPSLEKLPLSPALQEAGMKLARSSGEFERRAGIGLLGWFNNRECREMLTDTMQNDPDALLQMAAAKGLGRIGDTSTLALLKARALATPSPGRMGDLLRESIRDLEDRLRKSK